MKQTGKKKRRGLVYHPGVTGAGGKKTVTSKKEKKKTPNKGGF